jgi:hypothetical protein
VIEERLKAADNQEKYSITFTQPNVGEFWSSVVNNLRCAAKTRKAA